MELFILLICSEFHVTYGGVVGWICLLLCLNRSTDVSYHVHLHLECCIYVILVLVSFNEIHALVCGLIDVGHLQVGRRGLVDFVI